MPSYAEFENATDKRIVVTFEWDTNATSFTTVQPGETAEVVFNDNTAAICHRSDGGQYSVCPNKQTVARAGDYFILEEDGGYQS